MDDKGRVYANIGYRVQFNSTIGSYKGRLGFHQSVNLSTIRFYGCEKFSKNSFTDIPVCGKDNPKVEERFIAYIISQTLKKS
ncbi:MAG: Glu/Leu/Phe/Val dehydrogenase dimerization domain-containing protein [Christensenellales bacterium]